LGKKRRKSIDEEIRQCIHDDIPFCIFATGSLIGEGFDLAVLDTLFLTMPVSFKGRIIQYAGRLHREHDEKSEVLIYDYLDINSGLPISMFKKRVRAYKKMGYHIDIGDNPRIARWLS
jgi:superfamily II DNA or RNA helicase